MACHVICRGVLTVGLFASAVACADSTLAPADNAASSAVSSDVPAAPAAYRRPPDWKPSPPFPKTLPEIARDHSAETMARARAQREKVEAVNRAGKYAATGAGMDRHACPDWFIDAKLGMFVDWGPWSIAAYSPYVKGARLYPDWYEYKCRPEYTAKDSAAAYHRKNWGADFKPDHFIGLFRGTRFDAAKMMKVFRRCGAKYVVPFLKHHSGFCLWDDPFTFRDTVDGPAKRDFAREMADAARAEGLKFGVYNSQADEWEYPILQDDGSIRMKIWGGKVVDYTPEMEGKASGKIAVRDFVRDYIVPQMTTFIDRYDPDLIWYDADWATRATENGSYDITAYFYNRAEGRKEVCCNDRYGRLDPAEEAAFGRKGVKLIGCRTVRGDFFTDEWGDTAENINPKAWHPWESCSGISKAYGNHWMEELDPSMVMSDKAFICHFTSIVARGGNLLLLVNLDAQGAIPKIQETRLLSIGRWLEKNGEAIYATRIVAPFSTPAVDYTRSKDGAAVYAIVKEPTAEVALECRVPAAARVTVLGESAALPVRREGAKTMVRVPARLAQAELPFVLKIDSRANDRDPPPLKFSNGTVGTYQRPVATGDFGRDAFGWLEVRAEPPAPCVLRLGEQLNADGSVNIRPAGTIRGCEVRFTAGRAWTRVPLVPDSRNTRGTNGKAIAIALPEEVGVIMPFRYVQRVSGPQRLEMRRVMVHWPMTPRVSFRTDNPDLRRLWDFCQYSMIATSFAGLMVDGDRERIPYEGDIYINMMGQLYGVDGDPELARRSIRHVLKYPTWPLEWQQHAIMCVWEDWHFTGETTLVAETYAQLRDEKLQREDANGLVMNLKGCIVDWPPPERDGYDMKARGNTVVNCFHYRNLLEMRDLAQALGKASEAAAFAARAARVKEAVNAQLFDAARGLYVDGLGSSHVSLHANAAALAFGLVPAERRAKPLDYIVARGMACSPYFAQYYLEALCLNGRKDAALRLMLDKGARSWLGMMAQGSTITMEAWSLKAKPNQDWNHAWGAAPLNILARFFQ